MSSDRDKFFSSHQLGEHVGSHSMCVVTCDAELCAEGIEAQRSNFSEPTSPALSVRGLFTTFLMWWHHGLAQLHFRFDQPDFATRTEGHQWEMSSDRDKFFSSHQLGEHVPQHMPRHATKPAHNTIQETRPEVFFVPQFPTDPEVF